MVTYSIQGRNGKTYEFDGPEGITKEQAQAFILSKDPDAGVAPTKDATIGSSLVGGLKMAGSQTQTGLASLFGDPAEAARAGVQRSQDISQEMGTTAGLDSIAAAYDQNGVLGAAGEVAGAAPQFIAQNVAPMGAMGVGAVIGRGIGMAAGPVGSILGGLAGARLGAAVPAFGQHFGSNLEAQAQEDIEQGRPVDVNRGTAALAAAGQTALDVVGLEFAIPSLFKKIMGTGSKEVKSARLLEAAKRSTAGTVGKGMGRGLIEVPTEVGQEIIQRAQAGQDLTSEDAMKQYGEVALQAAIVGPAAGGVASTFDRSSARNELRRQKIDPETGDALTPIGEIAVDPEREAALKAEQGPSQDRTALREAQLAQYAEDIDPTRTIADLEEEIASLTEDGLPSRALDSRISRIKKTIRAKEREEAATTRATARQQKETDRVEQERLATEREAAMAAQIDAMDPDALMVDRDRVKSLKGRSPEQDAWLRLANRKVAEYRNAQRTRNEELIAIAERNEAAQRQIPVERSARSAASTFGITSPVITKDLIREVGLPPRAGYARRLEGKDLSDPAQFQEAMKIIHEAQRNPRVTPETRAQLEQLLTLPEFQGVVADPQAAIAEGAPPAPAPEPEPLTPQTAPLAFTPEVFDTLRIGKTAKLRKDAQVTALDAANVDDRQMMLDILEALRDTPSRSSESVDLIDAYRQRIADLGDQPYVHPTQDESVVPNEPATSGAGVGVAVPGSAAVPGQTVAGTPDVAGTTGPDTGGLDGNTGGDAVPANPQIQRNDTLNPPLTPAQARNQEARFGDYDPDVMFVGSDTYQIAQAAGDVPGVSTPSLQEAFDAQDPTAALIALRDNVDNTSADGAGFNGIESLLAQKMLDTGNRLPAMQIVDTLPDDAQGNPVAGQYDAVTDTIRLVRGQADSHTFLHEMTHAFVHRFITQQTRRGFTNPHVKELMDLYAHVKRMMPDSTEYGLANVSEFASEAMSNRSFQMKLMGIPYRRQTLWRWFSRAVGKLLGVNPSDPVSNTFMAAVVHVDGLMNPGRRAQIDETGTHVMNPVVNSIATQKTPAGSLTPDDLQQVALARNQTERDGMKSFLAGVRGQEGDPSWSTRFRSVVGDNLASITEKLGYELRDAFGNLNPIQLMRQAIDYKRVAVQFFRDGGIHKGDHQFWATFENRDENGNKVSPEEALRQITAFGEKYGMDYETAKARVATMMEGLRLNELRAGNQRLEELPLAYEARATRKGDKKADETRAKKKKLHMLNAEIDELVATANNYPEVASIQAVLNKSRDSAIDAMVASGRISEKTGSWWKENANYVPFDRVRSVLDVDNTSNKRGRRGIAELGSLPTLEGSYNRPVANTINNYMDTLSWMIGQAMRNDGAFRVLKAMEEGGYAKRLTTRPEADNKSLISPTLYEDGEPVFYELYSAYDLAAFSLGDGEPSGAFMNAATMLSRVLRATITAVPTFSLNQTMQDVPRVVMLSGTNSAAAAARRTLVNFPKNYINGILGRQSEVSTTMHRTGVVGAYDYNPTDPLASIERDLGHAKYGVFGRTLHHLEQIAKASDQAARQAIYEQTMLETGDEALAIVRAREIINFNRRGSSSLMRGMTKIIPFFNAYVQGMDLMYRGFTGRDSSTGMSKRQAQAYFMTRLGLMTAMGTAYALAMSDDEDYQNTADHVRQRLWMLPHSFSKLFDGPNGEHTPLGFPQPREMAFLFKTMPEMFVQYMKEAAVGENKEPGEAVMDALKAMKDIYFMEPIPAYLKPTLEIVTNHSFFTGRPLIGEHMINAPAALQVNAGTSEFARALGKATNVSPIKIDTFVTGTFGLASNIALDVTDMLLNPNLPDRPLNKIAGLSTFTTDQTGKRDLDEFYDLRQKVDYTTNGLRMLEGDPVAYQEFAKDHGHYLAAKPWVDDTLKTIRELRKLREIYQRGDAKQLGLTPEERRTKLRELDQLQSQLLTPLRKIRAAAQNAKQ